jgi:hypothetical protein
VGGYLRKLVSVVTAALVLLSNVYCACAHAAPPAPRDPAAADAVPACHAHHAKHQPAAPEKTPANKLPCQHCKPAASAVDTAAKVVGSPHAVHWLWAVPVAPIATPDLAIAARHAALALDLPPPRQDQSLLSLHCALNT